MAAQLPQSGAFNQMMASAAAAADGDPRLPVELTDPNLSFKDVLANVNLADLPHQDQVHLSSLLPADTDMATQDLFKDLLAGERDYHFGAPLQLFEQQLQTGRLNDDVQRSRKRRADAVRELSQLSASTDRAQVLTRLLRGEPPVKIAVQLPRPTMEYQRNWAMVNGASVTKVNQVKIGTRQREIKQLLQQHKHRTKPSKEPFQAEMTDVTRRVFGYTDATDTLPDAVRYHIDDLGSQWDEGAGSFFGLLFRIIYPQTTPPRSLSQAQIAEVLAGWQEDARSWTCQWRRSHDDFTKLLEPALCYLAGMPGTLGVADFQGFFPLVHLQEDQVWTWTSKPLGSALGYLAVLADHFFQTLSEAEPPAACIAADEESRRLAIEHQHALRQAKKREKLNFRDMTIGERAEMQSQEQQRFDQPEQNFTYELSVKGHSYRVTVPQLVTTTESKGSKSLKARAHPLLVDDRPASVTLSHIVMDILARMPSRAATKVQLCDALRYSVFTKPGSDPKEAVVGAALDRLSSYCSYDVVTKQWSFDYIGIETVPRPPSPSAWTPKLVKQKGGGFAATARSSQEDKAVSSTPATAAAPSTSTATTSSSKLLSSAKRASMHKKLKEYEAKLKAMLS